MRVLSRHWKVIHEERAERFHRSPSGEGEKPREVRVFQLSPPLPIPYIGVSGTAWRNIIIHLDISYTCRTWFSDRPCRLCGLRAWVNTCRPCLPNLRRRSPTLYCAVPAVRYTFRDVRRHLQFILVSEYSLLQMQSSAGSAKRWTPPALSRNFFPWQKLEIGLRHPMAVEVREFSSLLAPERRNGGNVYTIVFLRKGWGNNPSKATPIYSYIQNIRTCLAGSESLHQNPVPNRLFETVSSASRCTFLCSQC